MIQIQFQMIKMEHSNPTSLFFFKFESKPIELE